MKSMLVSNQTMRNESEAGRGQRNSGLHSRRDFDFFEESQQNSYC